MSAYASYINMHGTPISISDKLRKHMKIKPSELRDVAPKYVQHANVIVDTETGERTWVGRDLCAQEAAVEDL